jgi:osmoprotectant transport system permease protein
VNLVFDVFARALEYALGHRDELLRAFGDHLLLVAIALGAALVVGIPLGIWSAKSRWVSLAAMNVIGGMRVIPSLAILFLVVPYLGLSTGSAAAALILLALPPILINTDAGFRTLDDGVVEAARGMGMSAWQRLARVEFPLAFPIVVAGVRTAAVEVISSATLAAFVGAGGLGIYITRGFALFDYAILMVGAVPVALLALASELLLGRLQHAAIPGK